MVILVFISRKGGVGKTTCAFNVGVGLPFVMGEEEGASKPAPRVLIVDLDRQKDMTFRFDKDYMENSPRAERNNKSVYDFLTCKESEKELLDCVHMFKNCGVIYASSRNDEIEDILKRDPRLLSKRLSMIASRFDVCILDLPPAQDAISFSALVAGDYAFPCSDMQDSGLYGVRDAMLDIMEVKRVTGHNVKVPLILTRADTKAKEDVEWYVSELRRYTQAEVFFHQYDQDLLRHTVRERKIVYYFYRKHLARAFAELCVVLTLYCLKMPLKKPGYAPFAYYYETYEADVERQKKARKAAKQDKDSNGGK